MCLNPWFVKLQLKFIFFGASGDWELNSSIVQKTHCILLSRSALALWQSMDDRRLEFIYCKAHDIWRIRSCESCFVSILNMQLWHQSKVQFLSSCFCPRMKLDETMGMWPTESAPLYWEGTHGFICLFWIISQFSGKWVANQLQTRSFYKPTDQQMNFFGWRMLLYTIIDIMGGYPNVLYKFFK